MKPIKVERGAQRGNWDRGFAVEILHPGLTLSGGTAESAPWQDRSRTNPAESRHLIKVTVYFGRWQRRFSALSPYCSVAVSSN